MTDTATAQKNRESELTDPISITFFKKSYGNTEPDKTVKIEWDEFSHRLSEPEKGSKNGDYFVRTSCNGSRCDENMYPLADVVIIDADKGQNKADKEQNKADKEQNDTVLPSPDYVADSLQDLDYQFILYTSFSHVPDAPRYRILFLLDRPVDKEESDRLYRGMLSILETYGIFIRENSESCTWSQPFFFPRYKSKKQKKNFFHTEGGFNRLPVDKILSEVREEKKIEKTELSENQAIKLKQKVPGCIEFFSADTSLDATATRNFNLIKMALVGYAVSIGLDEDEAVSLCREFIDHYSFSDSLKTPAKRERNFRSCYRSMKNNDRKFSCAAANSLGSPPDTFDCNDCHVNKPFEPEEVLEWIEETEDEKVIRENWIEKTRGMDATSTEMVLTAVSKKTKIGKRPLGKDLKKKQIEWLVVKRKIASEKRAAQRIAEGKTEIIYRDTAIGDAVRQLSKALADSNSLSTVYRYGSTLVSIVNAKPSSVRLVKRAYQNNGVYPPMPIIHSHSDETLRHEVEGIAYCMEADKYGFLQEIKWPKPLLKGLMDTPNSYEKPLIGIVEHPYVDENYSLVTGSGYDPQTGLFKYMDSHLDFAFGELVTDSEAEKAYIYLRDEVMADFPFAGEVDVAAAISTMLTAIQRKLITGDSGCPGYLFDAPVQSTGKTTLAQIISYSIYNRPAAATSWSNSDDELGKHILGILREGHSCVLFDNVPNGTLLESDEMAKAMTSATYSKRLLGENKTVTVPSSVLWIFTGNNISVAGDFNTRILSIRLDAKTADPDKRRFKRPDIGEWCTENRNDIIGACLAIILAAKDVDPELSPTRYNEWDKFVRFPIYNASGQDIAELFERNKANDPKIEGQKIFLETMYEVFRGRPVSAKEILDRAYSESGDFCEDATGLCDAIKDIFSRGLPNTLSFGKWLGGLKDRVIGNYRLTKTDTGTDRKNQNAGLWRVECLSEDSTNVF